MTHILRFEDHPRVMKAKEKQNSQSVCLEKEPVVQEENPKQAVHNDTYVVLLDMTLPNAEGLLLQEKSDEQGDVRILVLSPRRANADLERKDRIGGGYRQRIAYNPKEVVEKINSMLQQRDYLDINTRTPQQEGLIPRKLQRGPLTLDLAAMVALLDGRNLGLTPREFALLLALVRADGACLSVETLYHIAWGMSAVDDNRAVRIQISRLRTKLNQASGERIEITAQRGVGYRLNIMDLSEAER